MNPTAAVILAAGGGTRFAGAGHKLLAEIDGRSVVARSVGAAIDACVGPVIVVWGAVDVRDELEGLDVTYSDGGRAVTTTSGADLTLTAVR